MDNQLKSISKVFIERLYRIPDYQRGFAWQEKHLKDFWNDILQLEEQKNHYVGVLTLEAIGETEIDKFKDDLWIIDSKSYEPFYIVDGQQRITTALILLQAILDSVKETDELNYTSVQEIRKKYIFDSKDGGISRSYIFGYDDDNPSYEFLKTKIFNEKSSKQITKQETIYTHNLEFAKKYFIEKLSKLTFADIEKIFKKLTQNLLFNIYTISSDIDVHVTFEGMNNRGKPLSILELLKNRLIYLSTKFDTEAYEKTKLRDSINDCWKSIYHELGKNKDNPLDDDKFLLNHFLVYFGEKLFPKNDDERKNYWRVQRFYRYGYSNFLLENIFTLKNIVKQTNPLIDDDSEDSKDEKLSITDVYKYVSDLQNTVQTWFNLFNPYFSNDFSDDEKIILEKLNRLGFEDVATLVLIVYQKEKNKTIRSNFLTTLERFKFIYGLSNFMYRRFIGPLDFKYIELAVCLKNNKIKTSDIIVKINEDINSLISKSDFIEGIQKDFARLGFYKWDGIRYFLYEYEEELKNKSKTKRRKIDWREFNELKDDFITIEHIYPQKATAKCWTDEFKIFNSRQKEVLRNSLGNLLPLSKPKNSSLQNKCFVEKVSNDNNTVGYRYGSYSENEVTCFDKWTSKNILERGIKLLEFLEKRWEITIGNHAKKVKFLNLEFVENNKKSVTKKTT